MNLFRVVHLHLFQPHLVGASEISTLALYCVRRRKISKYLMYNILIQYKENKYNIYHSMSKPSTKCFLLDRACSSKATHTALTSCSSFAYSMLPPNSTKPGIGSFNPVRERVHVRVSVWVRVCLYVCVCE